MRRAIPASVLALFAISAAGCDGGGGGETTTSPTTGSGGGSTSTTGSGGTGGTGGSTSSSASTGGNGGGGASSASASASSGTGGGQPVCPPVGNQNYVAACPNDDNHNGTPCSPWGDICMTGQCICQPQQACKPFSAIACDQNRPGAIAVDANNVYWLTGDPFDLQDNMPKPGPVGVMTAPKGGGNTVVLAANEIQPSSLAVDATHVYWTSLGEDAVKRVPIAGGNVELLVNGQPDPVSLATDGVSLYWISGGSVMKMPVAGGNPTTLVSGAPFATALTVAGGQIYYATNDGAVLDNSTIRVVPAAGGNPTVLAAGQTNTAELAVQGGFVYWSNRGNGGVPNGPSGSVARVSTGGGAVETLTGGPTMFGGGLAVDASTVYWAATSVQSVPVGGGTLTLLAQYQKDPSHIAADATHVYWTDDLTGLVLVMDK